LSKFGLGKGKVGVTSKLEGLASEAFGMQTVEFEKAGFWCVELWWRGIFRYTVLNAVQSNEFSVWRILMRGQLWRIFMKDNCRGYS